MTALVLEAKHVWYYSEYDEMAFFEWLNKLACVVKYEGRSDTLYITVDQTKVDESCLRELLALFHRYGIDLKQLKALNDDRFANWFRDPRSYWFEPIFKTE